MLVCKKCGSHSIRAAVRTAKIWAGVTMRGPAAVAAYQKLGIKEGVVTFSRLTLVADDNQIDPNKITEFKCADCDTVGKIGEAFVLLDYCRCGTETSEIIPCYTFNTVVCKKCRDIWACKKCRAVDCEHAGKSPLEGKKSDKLPMPSLHSTYSFTRADFVPLPEEQDQEEEPDDRDR